MQINCSLLYFYWQTIAWKFSDHGWYFQGGHGPPWFFPPCPTCRRPWQHSSSSYWYSYAASDILHYCGQTAGWMKTPFCTEVDLGAGHIVLDGFSALRKRGRTPPVLGPCLLWPRSPISATAELLLNNSVELVSWSLTSLFSTNMAISENSVEN